MLRLRSRSELALHPQIAVAIDERTARTNDVLDTARMIDVERDRCRERSYPFAGVQRLPVTVECLVGQDAIERTVNGAVIDRLDAGLDVACGGVR